MSGEIRWLAEHRIGGVLHGRVGRAGDELVAEWTGVAQLFVKRNGSLVRFVADPGAAAEDVEKIRRGSARLLLRHLDGNLALHGAAVALEGRAIGLFGAAEAGKSTLAAELCMRRGAELLADDAIALERSASGFDVVGLEVDHWLDAAARRALGVEADANAHANANARQRSGKRPLRAASPRASGAPLAALVHVVFAREGAPRLTPLAGVEAVACLLGQMMRFVVDEPELQRKELETIAELIARVPVFRLARPPSLELLSATSSLVADLARPR